MANQILDNVLKVVKIILMILCIMFIIFLIIILMILLFFPIDDWGEYCDKNTLQNTVIQAVKLDAPLDQIEYKYSQREKIFLSQIKKFLNIKNDKYYPMDVSLYVVLIDIKYSKNTSVSSEVFKKRLDKLINEYERKNPFSRLSPQQRYYFENIKNKTGKNYNKIKLDLNKIYLDMEYRNKKIEEWKSKAKWRFMISVFCIIITLLMLLLLIVFFIRSKIKSHKKKTNIAVEETIE